FVALTVVKIPVSRLRYALGSASSSEEDEQIINMDECTRLLENQKFGTDNRTIDVSRDPSVEDIFHKTDATIAQVRETLPEDGIPGSFHFVDARPPDTVCSAWALVAVVVLIFMVVPLLLTYYEEHENEDQA
ncbi:hypothetical protein TELCIR_26175, partial [Teladorsagia circumcincta]